MTFFTQYNLFGANVYMCYDYVHLDNLSDVSAYRNHNIFLCPSDRRGAWVAPPSKEELMGQEREEDQQSHGVTISKNGLSSASINLLEQLRIG